VLLFVRKSFCLKPVKAYDATQVKGIGIALIKSLCVKLVALQPVFKRVIGNMAGAPV